MALDADTSQHDQSDVTLIKRYANRKLYNTATSRYITLKGIAELIEAHGLDRLRAPYVRHIRGKLWEMRMKGRDGISRALYVAASGRRVGPAFGSAHFRST